MVKFIVYVELSDVLVFKISVFRLLVVRIVWSRFSISWWFCLWSYFCVYFRRCSWINLRYVRYWYRWRRWFYFFFFYRFRYDFLLWLCCSYYFFFVYVVIYDLWVFVFLICVYCVFDVSWFIFGSRSIIFYYFIRVYIIYVSRYLCFYYFYRRYGIYRFLLFDYVVGSYYRGYVVI